MQVRGADGYPWLVGGIDAISQGPAPKLTRQMLGPGFREVGHEEAGALFIRRYRVPGPRLEPLRLRQLRHAQLNFRNVGVLVDGVGPG
jgi:hypothetical protein